MYLTYFGANSWLLEWDSHRILVDPWLVGDLVFANLPWLFRGQRRQNLASLPDGITTILLSQGLDDHTHRPTLARLDRSIPVVGSPSAAKVVEAMGYTQVTALKPGQTFTLNQSLEVRALPGAPIGLQVENGYVLKSLKDGTTLYYEPHGFPAPELQHSAPIDVVISPLANLELPLLGPIVQGHKSALQLIQWVNPKVFLPTTTGGDLTYHGVLNGVLRTIGDLEELRSRLLQHQLQTQVLDSPLYQKTEIVVN